MLHRVLSTLHFELYDTLYCRRTSFRSLQVHSRRMYRHARRALSQQLNQMPLAALHSEEGGR